MEPHSFVLLKPYWPKQRCRFKKASGVIRKLSLHLAGSSRFSCIHWAPLSLGMGLTTGASILCTAWILRSTRAALAKFCTLGTSLQLSLVDEFSLLPIFNWVMQQKNYQCHFWIVVTNAIFTEVSDVNAWITFDLTRTHTFAAYQRASDFNQICLPGTSNNSNF